jgi:hypothetical protein
MNYIHHQGVKQTISRSPENPSIASPSPSPAATSSLSPSTHGSARDLARVSVFESGGDGDRASGGELHGGGPRGPESLQPRHPQRPREVRQRAGKRYCPDALPPGSFHSPVSYVTGCAR